MKKTFIKIALFCAFSATAIYAYIDSSVSNYKEINSNESSLINNDYDDNKLSVPVKSNENNTTKEENSKESSKNSNDYNN